MNKRLKCLSLFSNVGMAETYFEDIGIDVVIANELLEERANFYRHLYPKTNMICGDIREENVRDKIVKLAKIEGVDFVLATPPCQGMSRHGKRDPNDVRNELIYYAVDVIKRVLPSFVLLENVPKLLTTKIKYNDSYVYIFDYIKMELNNDYWISDEVLFNSADCGVPQSRTRCIIRMIRKDLKSIEWANPQKQKHINMREAIGDLPSLDPNLREENMRYMFPEYEKKKEEGLKISKWHYPPTHSWKQVEWMIHTPSGKTAAYNKTYYPQKNGRVPINARLSCYRRYSWDRPANTVTQNNGVISSATCVHPGRVIVSSDIDEKRIYSDPRVLSLYELFIISSLPKDWKVPEWANESLIRHVIGEGIPPLMIKAIVLPLMEALNYK